MTESTDSTSTSGARGRAADLKQRLREDGKQRIESGKRAAADQIADIAEAIDAACAKLDPSQPAIASYASRLAGNVSGLAAHLREDSIEDLYYQVRQLAVRHPGMFLLGSAALGIALARFMKASERNLDALYEEDLGEASEEQSARIYRASATPDTYGERGV
ncbi:hypothetical protein [Steroidobacter agaridevorans]|uniref:hypothetical protein n=1 Tax=Steroidobacter agaridevorans TaxID=2695856 RepID=UPI001328D8F5|nr:hypothetical protein [Steroidobacter agaridevorans]GFE90541.1 hypothetical protein GCM10011488_54950 [Steroidobacter agaridevorans]